MKFNQIDAPETLKKLSKIELLEYSDWLRENLINTILNEGGHFSSNLGVVELTVALHYVYNAPNDILVWDVGHQCYAHKWLTKRKDYFKNLRKKEGISGFPSIKESKYDAFGTAHSSTSISAALGYAVAAKFKNINRQNIAIIGDGAMSSGQAFEALNNASTSNTNIKIIINDNHIGIDKSQGALGEHLNDINPNDNIFTNLGFLYFGPFDGHNLIELIDVFEKTKNIETPHIIHIKTVKGKGHIEAEEEQTKWHSVSQFDKINKKDSAEKQINYLKFQDIFGKHLLNLAYKNTDLVAVTPAMITGSSLHFMQEKFPERVFDVNIAEQHSVTFSAAMSLAGMKVVCCLYSTFLQRAVDQIIHDVALQNIPMIFAIDRAGFVGEDGPTHHGLFDLNILQSIPNISIYCPKDEFELGLVLTKSIENYNEIVFIRYPRGESKNIEITQNFNNKIIHEFEILKKGNKNLILTFGNYSNKISNFLDAEKSDVSHIHLLKLKPFSYELIKILIENYDNILFIEENYKYNGVSKVLENKMRNQGFRGSFESLGLEDEFYPIGKIDELIEMSSISKMNVYLWLKNFN